MLRFILALTFVASSLFAVAQSIKPVKFTTGSAEFAAGVGVVPTYVADGGKTLTPPVSLRLDYYLSENLSLGLYGAYSKTESDLIVRPTGVANIYQSELYMMGLRGTAMSNNLNNWRIYGGFMLGYSVPNVDTQEIVAEPKDGQAVINPRFSREPQSQMFYSGFVGAKRYFTPRVGAYAEAGFGVSLLNLGVTIKLH